MKIKDIKIGDRFRKDLGDTKTLAKSIQEVGLLHPVVINENNELIAGQRRIQAYESLGYKEIPTTIINLQDIVKGELHENTVRKNFTFSERAKIREVYKPKLQEEQNKGGRGKKTSPNLGEVSKHDHETSGKLASYFGISHGTNDKEERIFEAVKNNPEQFKDLPEKIDAGLSVDYADKMVRTAESHKKQNIPELPQGQFDIILADPPWEYDINTRGSPDEHYTVMTNQQIQDLEIPSAKNCILFLWATGPKLPEALSVIKKWKFKYKTSAVWVKDKIGTGYYFRGQHELLLIAEKGDMPVPQEKDRPSSVIQSPRGKHSEKPEVVYDIIESMYPNRSYLELFARKQRQGWTSWGNEIS